MGIGLHVHNQTRIKLEIMSYFSLTKKSRLAPIILLLASLVAGCRSASSEGQFLSRGKQLIDKKEYARAILEFRNASRLQPKSAEPYYQAALAYLGMGDYQTAYLSLIRATELDPKHQGAQQKLAEIIGSNAAGTRDANVLKSVEQRVQSALAILPDNADVLGALGVTEYLLGRPDDATKHLQAALQKFPKHLQSAKALATIKLNQNDLAGAEEVLRKVAQEPPQSAEAQVALGRFYEMNRRGSDAEAAYRRAVSINPGYGPALRDLAQLQLRSGQKADAEKTLVALSALPDKQYRPVHAIFLFEQGRQDEAIHEFERQVRDDKEDREALSRLISAYFFTKRFPEAENTINAALKKNPKNSAALIQRCQLYVITSKFAEAQVDLNQVLKLQPDLPAAHYLLSKVYQARGQRPLRRDQLAETLRLEPNMLSARLELAELLLGSGGAKAAREILEQTPASQAQMLPVIIERNWTLLSLGDFAELRKGLDRSLTQYKTAPDLLLQDGMLRLKNMDIRGARRSLEQVLAIAPRSVPAVDALAKSYVMQRQPALALQTVMRYASQRPDSAPLQHLLGNWLAANNRFDEARKVLNAAIAADPAFADARIAAAYVELADRKLEAARSIFGSIPSSGGCIPCELGLAQVEEKAGNPTAAIPHYRKVLDIDPSNVPALNGLAYTLANQTDQIDEALKYAQQAKELAPNNVYVEDTIGWAYYRKGLYASAVEHLRGAAAKEGMTVPKYHLAMAYLKTGDTQRGQRLLQQAMSADPRVPEAAAAEKLLAELSIKRN